MLTLAIVFFVIAIFAMIVGFVSAVLDNDALAVICTFTVPVAGGLFWLFFIIWIVQTVTASL